MIHYPDRRIGARSHTKVVTYSHFWVCGGLVACVELRFVIARRNGVCADVEPGDCEVAVAVEASTNDRGSRQLDAFLRRARHVIEPVTVQEAHFARQAYSDFGEGRHAAETVEKAHG